uniref:Peptidase_M3 domain-containing protein n=1 Tax=Caenorhabditis tropicalis TaxID=1561998 RepID=A0A1I7TE57_9PELO
MLRTIVDDISNEICKSADLAECVRQLHSDLEFREAAENVSREFCELVESLNTNTALYQKLKSSEITESSRLDDVDRRTLALLLDDFEQSGVHLKDEQKAKFVQLSSEVFNSGARFQENCDRIVSVGKFDQAKYGLPSQIYSPVSNSVDQSKRKMVYNTFYRHDDQQEKYLQKLISSRHQLAQLTGFESFAHRAQRNSLLEDYDNVKTFLWGVVEKCRNSFEKELAVLIDISAQCNQYNIDSSKQAATIADHDLGFLMHLYREKAYDIAKVSRESSQFFTFSSILNGFSTLSQRLYGVQLVEEPLVSGEMWNTAGVLKLKAVDEQMNELGVIYVDVSIRPEKAVGDCHYTVRCSKYLSDATWQMPILVLSLGLVDGHSHMWRDSGISFHSAETMFHELGHAMHSILGRTKYQHVAGTRCPQDFSEIPSNLMEYFISDLGVMTSIIRRSDRPSDQLSVEAAATLLASRHSFTAIETVQQAAYGLYDLEVHGPIAAPQIATGRMTTTELFYDIMSKAMPHVQRSPDSAFQHRFHHTVQYGAKYYSYLVARASACLIWQNRFLDEPFSRKWGDCWAEVQSHGGGHHPAVLLKKILGFRPTEKELTIALSKESQHLANLDAITV